MYRDSPCYKRRSASPARNVLKCLNYWLAIQTTGIHFPKTAEIYISNHCVPRSQSSSVGTVTALRAGQCVVQIPVEAIDFTLLIKVQTVSEVHRFSFLGLKRPGLVVNHTLLPSVQVKNKCFPCMHYSVGREKLNLYYLLPSHPDRLWGRTGFSSSGRQRYIPGRK